MDSDESDSMSSLMVSSNDSSQYATPSDTDFSGAMARFGNGGSSAPMSRRSSSRCVLLYSITLEGFNLSNESGVFYCIGLIMI